MTALPFAATTPLSIGRVGLKARSAERLAAYYRDVLGLAELSRADGTIVLGAGERPLLVLEEDPAARADDPRAAGLFHTAFLLPSRGDLARWLSHAVAERVSVDGASDHLVSEAIYLTDPEGNGVEIYADWPRELWTWRRDGVIDMATLRLDLPGLVASVPEVERSWRGAPDGTVIGHVHLRVGEPDLAEAWWHQRFGLDTVHKLAGSAVFLSSGGYHHHVGVNSWQSRGAGPRDPGRSGLAWLELQGTELAPGTFSDPWGTEVRAAARN